MPLILDPKRQSIFDRLAFLSEYGALAGGTAIALQLGHRTSYDFDIFSPKSIPSTLLKKIETVFANPAVALNTADELTLSVENEIKLTVLSFPFPPIHPFEQGYPLPLWNLADLAGNKAYTIGRRGAYRDYVDIFALLQNKMPLKDIIDNANQRFGDGFNERLFLQQLLYLGDLDEFAIAWIWPEKSPEEVAAFLAEKVAEYTPSYA